MRRIISLCSIIFSAVTGGCLGIPFNPCREMGATPDDIGLAYENVRITTEDQEQIAGWFIPAKHDPDSPGQNMVLLFFHGNAGNLSHRLDTLLLFHKLGLSQLIIDYRGFGESSGKVSVNGTKKDARAAWAWLLREKRYAPKQVVLFGRSLGGGVAADLAVDTDPAGLILESTFLSITSLARDMYPLLPVSPFIPQDYDTRGTLAKITIPVLFVHSPEDEIIPYKHGKTLYEIYGGPKQFLEISGSHNSGFMESYAIYVNGLEHFLRSIQGHK